MADGTKKTRVSYVANVTLDYTDADGVSVNVPAGTAVDNIPAESIPWLLQQGLIEEPNEENA